MKHMLVIGLLMALSTLAAIAWLVRKTDSPLVKALKRRFPQAAVSGKGEQITIESRGASVALPGNVSDDERLPNDERRLVHLYAEIERALQRDPLGEVELRQLVPVPLNPQRTERTDEAARFVVHLHPELDVGFALDSTSSGRWLTDLDALELDPKEVLRTALTTLHRTTDGATVYRDGPLGAELYLVRQDDGLDSSRLLLAPLWERITDATGAPLVIAAPSRDRIYAAPADQPKSLDRLMERVRSDWDSRSHQVSTKLWVWSDQRLQPWHLHA